MKLSIKWIALSAVVIAGGLYVVVARADDAATLDTRIATMKSQGKDMAGIKAYIDDKADLASAQAAGADLVTQVAKIPDLFPKGTGMTQFPGKSYAKDAVWTDWDKFLAQAKTANDKAVAKDGSVRLELSLQ